MPLAYIDVADAGGPVKQIASFEDCREAKPIGI